MHIFVTDQNEEEYKLAENLKTIWDQNGKKENPTEFAKIFHQMARLYQKQSSNMFSLIRSAALYNAALVRLPDNVSIIKDLKLLCRDVVYKAKAQTQNRNFGKNDDLVELAKTVKQKFQHMRFKVNEKLLRIPVSRVNNLNKELPPKICQDKIRDVRELQKQITAESIKIMSELSDSCIKIIGEPPCKFALVGMGSLARQEITPFSDFEHIIVLEEISQQTDDNKEKILNYFRWFSVTFHIILINIRETIIPGVAIPSLNNHSKHGDWFCDKFTTRGVSFDGMMPHASKFPLGRRDLTQKKPWTTELIKPISEMLEYLRPEQDLKNGYHLKDILTKVCYVNGKQSIFNVFEEKKQILLDKEKDMTIRNEIKKLTNKDLNDFAARKHLLELKINTSFNLKRVIYRSTTLFISAFGRLNRIHASCCFDIVEELERKKKISISAKYELLFAVALACETRLRWYMKCESQNDTLESKCKSQNAIQLLSDMMGKTNVYNYFKIAYALQCGLTKELKAKKIHFYSNPIMLNCILFYCLGDNRMLNNYKISFFTSKQNKQENLFKIDECLLLLNKHAHEQQNQKPYKPAKTDLASKSIDIENEKNLLNFENLNEIREYYETFIYHLKEPELNKNNKVSVALYEIGTCMIKMDKPSAAKDYFQKSLEIDKRLSGDPQNDLNISVTLHSIGECLMAMDKPTEAMDHFQKSLQIDKRLSGNPQNDKSLSVTFHSIGECLMEMDKPNEAMDYFQKSLKIDKRLSGDLQNDRSLSITLHSIGECLMEMDKPTEAMDHFQKSLQIKQQLSGNRQNDRSLSVTLHSIGKCLMKMDKPTEAMAHFQKSLKIDERLSGDLQNDRSLSITLHSIGECLMEMDKPTEAMDHFQKSLQIKQQLSGEPQNNRSLSVTLHSIGECLMKMDKPTEAMAHFQKSLKIDERLSGDLQNDRSLSITLHSIGECLMEMDKPTEAMDHFQKSLQIKQQLSGNRQNDRSLSVTLHSSGKCLMEMDKPTEAMAHFQKSLKIDERLSGDLQNDRSLSITLHSIGECLMEMDKPTEAMDHFQKSLQIKQQLSGNRQNDRSLSVTLHSSGKCLMKMDKPTEAMAHFQKSLKIDERLSGDLQNDRSLSITLHSIGECLKKMDKPTEAMDHFQKSLEIKQRLSSDLQNNRSLSVTLHSIGKYLTL